MQITPETANSMPATGGAKGGHSLPSNFKHILSFCALRGGVPNKILLLPWSQRIWSPKNFGLATPLMLALKPWQHSSIGVSR